MLCPLCQEGSLHEWKDGGGQIHIGCSNYPKCRFHATSWDDVPNKLARFQHPFLVGTQK